MNRPAAPDKPLVIFDGYCNFCSGVVRFILKHEKGPELQFAHSATARARELEPLLPGHITYAHSLILVENGKIYTESSAALRIAGFLKFPWSWMKAFLMVPALLRNAVYRWFSRNRYRLMGQRDQCFLPEPAWKNRFLD